MYIDLEEVNTGRQQNRGIHISTYRKNKITTHEAFVASLKRNLTTYLLKSIFFVIKRSPNEVHNQNK